MLTDMITESTVEYDRQVITQIEAKLEEQGECWVWQGQYHRETPIRSYRGRRVSVRQLVYRVLIDDEFDQRLTTSCETTGCLNPAHMIAWDGPANAFVARNRKLSPDQRAEIMATPKEIAGSGERLAKRFGVSASLISKIRNAERGNKVGSL